jgi:hypothetical protein
LKVCVRILSSDLDKCAAALNTGSTTETRGETSSVISDMRDGVIS